jgi:hypothetical protein
MADKAVSGKPPPGSRPTLILILKFYSDSLINISSLPVIQPWPAFLIRGLGDWSALRNWTTLDKVFMSYTPKGLTVCVHTNRIYKTVVLNSP